MPLPGGTGSWLWLLAKPRMGGGCSARLLHTSSWVSCQLTWLALLPLLPLI